MDISLLLTNTLLPLILGLFIGLMIGFTIAKSKTKSSVLSGKTSDTKLQNEVLSDQVKQLEAKIKTLEKALELSSKN